MTKNAANSTFVPGDGFSQLHALPAVVTWAPTAPRSVSATAGDGRATVTWAKPASAGNWSFTVQKRTSNGSWANVGTYRTKGKKETRTINLPKGTYRAVVAGKFGHQTTVSGSGYLMK